MRTLVIDAAALARNLDRLRRAASARIIGVVKGNGYGLGLTDYARFLTEHGVDMLAVSTAEEAAALRQAGIAAEVLMLSSTAVPRDVAVLLDCGAILTVGSCAAAETVSAVAVEKGVTARVHVKMDTGMGRFGFLPQDVTEAAALLKSLPSMRVEGVFTHFANAADEALTRRQYQQFQEGAALLERAGIETGLRHVCASSAFLRYPEMQLDAVSFLIPDGTLFCAFMGTDRSLVGWKENLNLSFMDAVPAQTGAVAYVEDMARHCPDRPLRIGGHSKGGNLAAYAALHIDGALQRTRLLDTYNNDGPGFRKDVTDTEEYRRVAAKLHTYIPASSIVGVLLEHTEDYTVVASSSRAVMQHEPLTWTVQGRQFVRCPERSELGKASDDVLRQWIASMSRQEREEFSESLYDMLTQGGKLRSLEEVRQKDILRLLAADEKNKGIVSEVLRRLVTDVRDEVLRSAEAGLKGTAETLKETAGSLYQAGQKALEKRK